MKNQIIFIEWFYYMKLCHKFDMSRLIRKVYTYLKVFLWLLRSGLWPQDQPSSLPCSLCTWLPYSFSVSASACGWWCLFHSQLSVFVSAHQISAISSAAAEQWWLCTYLPFTRCVDGFNYTAARCLTDRYTNPECAHLFLSSTVQLDNRLRGVGMEEEIWRRSSGRTPD